MRTDIYCFATGLQRLDDHYSFIVFSVFVHEELSSDLKGN